jgi:hypothetical protein
MPQNTLLIRARKSAGFTTQRDLGRAVFSKLPMPAKDAYAQKKVSLWESGQAKPATEEIRVLAELLGLGFTELEVFFAAVLPLSAADTISALAKSGNPCLIASCFGGKTRDTTLGEMQDAFREALNGNVSVAIFFPYPLDVSVRDRSVHVRGLVGA